MSIKPSINLNPSIKKLLTSKFPSVKAKNSVISALSICTENFIELLVHTSATICNDNQKNLITPGTVLEALDQLDFPTLYTKAKELNEEISNDVKNKKDSWKALKLPENNLTEEESIRIQEELRKEAIQFNEDRQKKEQKSTSMKNET